MKDSLCESLQAVYGMQAFLGWWYHSKWAKSVYVGLKMIVDTTAYLEYTYHLPSIISTSPLDVTKSQFEFVNRDATLKPAQDTRIPSVYEARGSY